MDNSLTHLGCVYKLTKLIFIYFRALLFVNIIILYIFVYSCSFNNLRESVWKFLHLFEDDICDKETAFYCKFPQQRKLEPAKSAYHVNKQQTTG